MKLLVFSLPIEECHDFRLFPSSPTAKLQTPARASVTWTFSSFLYSNISKDLSYLILSSLNLSLSYHHSKTKAKLVSLEEPYLLGQRARLATGKPHPIRIGDLGIHHEITTLRWPHRHHPTTQGTIHGAPLPLPKVPIHLRFQRLQSRVGRTGDRWCLVRAFGPGLRM